MKKTKQTVREIRQRSLLAEIEKLRDDRRIVRIRAPRPGSYLTVLTSVKKMVQPERPWRSAKIESTGALSGNLKARVRANLVRIYGPLRVTFVEIPALAGGMRITVGNDLYCGSVGATVEALEDKSRD